MPRDEYKFSAGETAILGRDLPWAGSPVTVEGFDAEGRAVIRLGKRVTMHVDLAKLEVKRDAS